MADKEPRKRKKRKDASRKVHFTEDLHLEPSSVSQKTDSRDSDQETEDEAISDPNHQPSKIAKVVFVLLFSILVVTITSVFISLQGSDRQEVLESAAMDFSSNLQEASAIKREQIISMDSTGEEFAHLTVELSSLILEEISDVNSPASDYEDLNENFLENVGRNEKEEHEKSLEIYDDIIPEEIPENDVASEEFVEDESGKSDIVVDSVMCKEQFTKEPLDVLADKLEFPVDVTLGDSIYQEINDIENDSVTHTEDPVKNYDDTLQDNDEESSRLLYKKSDITNEVDYNIREKLDDIDAILEKFPEKALQLYEDILQHFSFSPRANYGKSIALDKIAELQHSNKLLEEAILSYQNVMHLKEVPEKLYILAGNTAVERMRFRGFIGKSLKLLIQMANKFPNDIDIRNQLAVGYLLIGQNKESKKMFLEVLKHNPSNGFAKVHLGFILKTDESNYPEAIKLMSEGIKSNETGVVDGRFFFHLGDALSRIGKNEEAMDVYKEGVKKKLFLSAYQRSLYNFVGLTGKPWWNPHETTYAKYFKILEKNWIPIRDEALALINRQNLGFMPESEGLQDNGEWRQFELFTRGKRVLNNCAEAPVTCAIVEQIPDAVGCKRGQVKFSIIQPGTHVWAHTGPTNCRLRAHLGLVVPSGTCIRVANETKSWEEGKVLLFDDSFEHEVWHNGSSFRLVLIADFWHPELTAHQKASLSPI